MSSLSSTSPRSTESTAAVANTSSLPVLSTTSFKSSTTPANTFAAPPFKSKSRTFITVPVDSLTLIFKAFLPVPNHSESTAMVPSSPLRTPITVVLFAPSSTVPARLTSVSSCKVKPPSDTTVAPDSTLITPKFFVVPKS